MHTGCRAHIPAWGTLKDGGGDCLSQFSDDGENTLGALLVVQAAAAFLPPSYLRLGGVIITCTFGGTGISSVTLRGGYATSGNVLGYAHHNIWSILHTLNFYRESSLQHYFFVGEKAN